MHFAHAYDATMLVEPTESESKRSLDWMIEQFRRVAQEAAVAPYMIETAPHAAKTAKVVKDQTAWISLYQVDDAADGE